MNRHINGWDVISRHLRLREKNQSDLARTLQISPAAVTQIKNGQFRLNPRQLQQIQLYLEFSSSACDDFFSEVFNARLQECHGAPLPQPMQYTVKVCRSSVKSQVPVAALHEMKNYLPALEPVTDFIRRISTERRELHCSGSRAVLRISSPDQLPDLSSGTMLMIDGENYPGPGEYAIAAWDDGSFFTGYYSSTFRRGRTIASLTASTGSRHGDARSLRWIYPAEKLTE